MIIADPLFPSYSRLCSLQETYRRHTLDKQALLDESAALQADVEKLNTAGPLLATRFKFYQDMRGYVTDLVECLDEKVFISQHFIWTTFLLILFPYLPCPHLRLLGFPLFLVATIFLLPFCYLLILFLCHIFSLVLINIW